MSCRADMENHPDASFIRNPMNRSQYLAQRDVQQFIEWLVPHLTDEGSLSHGFVDRRSGRQWQFAGLEDACEQYR